jgi:cysteinyl-tRNA synthetase
LLHCWGAGEAERNGLQNRTIRGSNPFPSLTGIDATKKTMALRTYNTLTREMEEFKPLSGNEVKVYICGLTVYDDMHIGHGRTYIAFDAILRYLRYKGYIVNYVQNITDIDDKIINRAREKGVDPMALSSEYALRSRVDQKNLGLLEADAYPKVSENIEEIIHAIQTLIEKDHAYVSDGSVYFDVSKFRPE